MLWDRLKYILKFLLEQFAIFALVTIVFAMCVIIFGECAFAILSWLLEQPYEGGLFIRWLVITLSTL